MLGDILAHCITETQIQHEEGFSIWEQKNYFSPFFQITPLYVIHRDLSSKAMAETGRGPRGAAIHVEVVLACYAHSIKSEGKKWNGKNKFSRWGGIKRKESTRNEWRDLRREKDIFSRGT